MRRLAAARAVGAGIYSELVAPMSVATRKRVVADINWWLSTLLWYSVTERVRTQVLERVYRAKFLGEDK